MQSLDIKSFPLTGRSLIEASAGTGKTYTITRLVVRHLLESSLTIDQILVVTFTKSATQELRQRIREFIHQVLQFLQEKIHDDDLADTYADFVNKENAIRQLKVALADFDLAPIFTIHGFCQRLLAQFSVRHVAESSDIISDEKELQLLAVKDFWREHIVEQDEEKTSWILSHWLQPEDLLEQVSPLLNSSILQLTHEKGSLEIKESWDELKELWSQHSLTISDHLLNYPGFNRNKIRAKALSDFLQSLPDFFNQNLPYKLPLKWNFLCYEFLLSSLNKNGRLEDCNHIFFKKAEQFSLLHEDWIRQLLLSVFRSVAGYVDKQVDRVKSQEALYSYNDLIAEVYQLVVTDNTSNQKISHQWPVALIDEFQDTDFKQYQIFSKLFASPDALSLVMIGDPKQSIYSFRGADVFTYQKARQQTRQQFTLETNYRSSVSYVEAINALFSFHKYPFILKQLIKFQNALPNELTDELRDHQGAPLPPVNVWLHPCQSSPLNKGEANQYFSTLCAREIQTLLQNENILIDGRRIKASDCAILVRTNQQALTMETGFKQGRHCLFIDDAGYGDEQQGSG